MTYRDITKAQLRVDEGWRNKPYRDTVGKLSGGCGRNLDDVGLRDDEISLMLENDLTVAEATARTLCQKFDSLSDNRKAVLLNLAFNIGQARLAGFHKFLAALDAGDYAQAAAELRSSKWATQVGQRADRLIKQMEIG